MTAFNVVRLRVKPGYDQQFVDEHQEMQPDLPGMRRTVLVKTGDHTYCFLGEWDAMDDIVAARPEMTTILDRFRHMLEDQGGDLGVTDPVSGEAVVDIKY